MAIKTKELNIDLDSQLEILADGSIKKVSGHECISQSIKTIISTGYGERLMLPEFGSGLNQLLFGHIDLKTAGQIQREISSSLTQWEIRINLLEVIVTPYPDKNFYDIFIRYEDLTDNSKGEFGGIVRAIN